MTGKLTTHVLDTAQGKPAANLLVELWSIVEDRPHTLLATIRTNKEGRVDQALLKEETMKQGTYELNFFAGEYFKKENMELPKPMFLDKIPVRFGISNPDFHYHIPLLLSPWTYSVYRGS